MTPPLSPAGGGRFGLRWVTAAGVPAVAKRGDVRALKHEAAALRALGGHDGVPRLLAYRPGLVVSSRVPGSPREVTDVSASAWSALGTLIRRLHDATPSDIAQTPNRSRPLFHDSTAHVRARVAGVAEAARAAGLDVDLPLPSHTGRGGFCRIHGDLTAENVVWAGNRPALVDWEFSRLGDPAEDLAYLVTVNRLPPDVAAAVSCGYDSPEVWKRSVTWRVVVAIEAATWWRAHGHDDRAKALAADVPLLSEIRDCGTIAAESAATEEGYP